MGLAVAVTMWCGLSAGLYLTSQRVRRMARSTPAGGPGERMLRHLVSVRAPRHALFAILALAAMAVFAPWFAPYNPIAQPDAIGLQSLPPSWTHLFGTDEFSRDVLSRVIFGTRISLSVAVLAIAVAASIGTLYGAIAGYCGGRADTVMMRAIDAALAIPQLLLLVAALALWQHVSVTALVVLIGATSWFHVSRLVRADVLRLRRQELTLAAVALGASPWRVLWRHILPNAVTSAIVALTLGIGNIIVLEAALSFLGLGVSPPTPSWGNMIHEGFAQLPGRWWPSIFPGIAIVVAVIAFNVLGDGVRDALDPHSRADSAEV